MTNQLISLKKIGVCGRSTNRIDAQVGAQIRARRRQLGMSHDEFARATLISGRKLQAYEAGEIRPKPAEIGALARVLAVPISYFFDVAEQSSGEPKRRG